MKLRILLLLLMPLMLFSCKKTISEKIGGTWKMIIVKDNITGAAITKPSTVKNDVIITFVPNNSTTGLFAGKTPSNDIGQDSYSLGTNQAISIPVLSMTKVAETSWGAEFVDNIRSAQLYRFDPTGKLSIRTATKTLTFEKL